MNWNVETIIAVAGFFLTIVGQAVAFVLFAYKRGAADRSQIERLKSIERSREEDNVAFKELRALASELLVTITRFGSNDAEQVKKIDDHEIRLRKIERACVRIAESSGHKNILES